MYLKPFSVRQEEQRLYFVGDIYDSSDSIDSEPEPYAFSFDHDTDNEAKENNLNDNILRTIKDRR